MTISLELLFFMTIILCMSTYIFYPIAIILIGKLFPFKHIKTNATPSVSILIAAYNEEKDIHKKLENTIDLDYPKEKIEIIVGSDGSTDRTVQIVSEFSKNGVMLLANQHNRGKTAVQNDLVDASKNDILIFTDAASFLSRDSLRNLVKSFSDSRVGGVAGLMSFEDEYHNITTQSQGLYWKYEKALREAESKIGRLIGVDGPLYAIRRENYVHLQPHIISDLMSPLIVLKQNKKIVLEKDAHVYEVPTISSSQEFNTRRRITLRGLTGIFSEPMLLNPIRYPFISIQIFFHKILRWFVGPLILLNLMICILLSGKIFYSYLLILHAMFFLCASIGWFAEKKKLSLIFLKVPYYFTLVNFAATMGILDFLMKKQAVKWRPVRRD